VSFNRPAFANKRGAEEMAAIIAFLCSPAGRNINGQIITASACEDF